MMAIHLVDILLSLIVLYYLQHILKKTFNIDSPITVITKKYKSSKQPSVAIEEFQTVQDYKMQRAEALEPELPKIIKELNKNK